jgi:hypothetical protein
VRADLQLEVQLAARPSIGASALAARVAAVRPASALRLAAIEDDFDVSIVPKPFNQILEEASILARDKEQVSSHVTLAQPFVVRLRASVSH